MPNTALLSPGTTKKAAPPTPADDPILAALNTYYFLTADQVQRLLYGKRSTKYAPLRLANLAAGGYVLADYPAPPRTAGRANGVYMLDDRGRKYVSGVLGLDVPKRFRPSEQTERSYSIGRRRSRFAVATLFVLPSITNTYPRQIVYEHTGFRARFRRRGVQPTQPTCLGVATLMARSRRS